MLFLRSSLFVVIRYFSHWKKRQLGNQLPCHSPTLKAGRKMQHLGMASTGTQTHRLAHCQAHPCPLNVHRMPGAAGRGCSALRLAKFYWPLEIQGQTDSTMHSFKFFALGKIRKFILSYFGFSGHRRALVIRKGWWWAPYVVAQDCQGCEGNSWWGWMGAAASAALH